MSNDAIQRKDRLRSDKTRRRLRAMIGYQQGRAALRFGVDGVCVIARRRCKDFRSDGDALVRTGPAGDQLDCIDAVHSGVHHLTVRIRYEGKPFRSWT
ncbi:hypothetical protein X743_19865 [Mesorhizobium sp. LNHC252B00]|uniref:hypothetical protein n=1 Tax=Mesorhizobium sp. LNHC252B00 TaxID=1287252 RepID=UPI0003CDDAB9|nr:hypothetical protein X743_19865 [Mesorhizobium sp. LNHC252B00]